MFKEKVKKIEWAGGLLELSTGKIARQADGSVMVRMGDSIVHCSSVSAKEKKEGIDFFPLTVHYREMASAVGKIPGGFFKREGKSTEKEILVSRLIDRPLRPSFHPAFMNDTQIICTVFSYDPKFPTDILAIIGSSAALAISGVPYQQIIAAARVGMIEEKFVLNPSAEDLKKSKLDLVVAGSKTSVMMVESEAEQLSEEQMLEAIKFGHASFAPVIEMIEELAVEIAKPKWDIIDLFPIDLKNQIRQKEENEIKRAFSLTNKQERVRALKQISAGINEHFMNLDNLTPLQINTALDEVKSDILREDLLATNVRIDGRKPDEIRQIECEVGLLPRAHGSSLFTRGETQTIVTATLGTGQDEQIVDSLDGEYKERFLLNYIFPPYSVGEAYPLKPPSRREVGHGKLAWRALVRALPSKQEFPYAIRIVSEVTESNGSSSMATVCGGSMALMNAGVPVKQPIAGIAMGLIKEDNKFVVLSDIIADEDYLGDMDFKVTGSRDGISALQMDIKISSITFEIMQQALSQARDGRIHILGEMEKAITEANTSLSKNAPSMQSFKINKDKIREVIGAGGKVIREICESTNSKIDISDEGMVSVSAVGNDNLEAAVAKIKAIALDPEVDDIFEGTVVKILDSGAFINYLPNRDGFVRISEIANEKIESVGSVLKVGDKIKVRVIGIEKGRINFTIKNVDKTTQSNKTIEQADGPKSEKEIKAKDDKQEAKNEAENTNSKRESRKKWQTKESPSDAVIKERKYFT